MFIFLCCFLEHFLFLNQFFIFFQKIDLRANPSRQMVKIKMSSYTSVESAMSNLESKISKLETQIKNLEQTCEKHVNKIDLIHTTIYELMHSIFTKPDLIRANYNVMHYGKRIFTHHMISSDDDDSDRQSVSDYEEEYCYEGDDTGVVVINADDDKDDDN